MRRSLSAGVFSVIALLLGFFDLTNASIANAEAITFPFFVRENYELVSFEILAKAGDGYSRSLIAVDGYLAPDLDYFHGRALAFYSRAVAKDSEPDSGTMKISITPIYADMLTKFGVGQKCRIFGVFLADPDGAKGKGFYSIVRIDRIEASTKTLDMDYRIAPSQ